MWIVKDQHLTTEVRWDAFERGPHPVVNRFIGQLSGVKLSSVPEKEVLLSVQPPSINKRDYILLFFLDQSCGRPSTSWQILAGFFHRSGKPSKSCRWKSLMGFKYIHPNYTISCRRPAWGKLLLFFILIFLTHYLWHFILAGLFLEI